MQWILKKLIGTKNERDIRKLRPLIERVNALEVGYQALPEAELVAKTDEFRSRLAAGVALDELLPEAFAVVKNACRRLCGREVDVCGHNLVWDMVPFDVQLIGALTLHQGKIAEMATGEGKTLVATMPVYLNALAGQGVHVVTVNDYLARRDSNWMGAVYKYLGLTVGCIQNQMPPAQRRQEYACDITYGTNSEFGFDYLRDQGMAMRPEEMVQRGYNYAIVDEIDSILIDEARTPLIISGAAPRSTHRYGELKPAVERLVRRQRDLCNELVAKAAQAIEADETWEAQCLMYQVHQGMPKNKQFMHLIEDPKIRRLLEKIEDMMLTDMYKDQGRELREQLYFNIDEKGRDANLTEKGCEALSPNDPEAYVLPDLVTALSELDGDETLDEQEKFKRREALQEQFAEKSERIHNVDQLIRAYCVYERDVEYVVQNNQVMIVDEFTGRLMPGRRWADGLHQAVEAKENVTIERETQTLATITIQNYFRMYAKLAGMTGTAETEADEFHQIYKLDVVVIPTNRPVRRVDYNDLIFKTQREKYKALIEEITDCHQRGQPVLVGTISVETSELISRMLRRANVPHNVLNAKNHEREAEIVSRAGQPGAVTIATNMAGRGTDIKLGPGVVHLDRELVLSQTRLKDRINGRTLREVLEETPCGLHVIGTERHESRRIDRQLRGRCARQGDPGSSHFYVSLEDELMRLFGSERMANIMERLGMAEGETLEHPWLNRSIESAQRRVEQHNFSIRKRTLEYDDVMNRQREVIYGFRAEVVSAESARETLFDVVEELIDERAELAVADGSDDGLAALLEWANATFPVGLRAEHLAAARAEAAALTEVILARVRRAYEAKATVEDAAALTHLERFIIVHAIDSHWQEYLRAMDALRQGVGLRAYGQRDPLVEFRHEASDMFADLMDRIKVDIVSGMFRSSTSLASAQAFMRALPQLYVHDAAQALGGGGGKPPPAPGSAARAGAERALDEAVNAPAPVRRDTPKVGRNDPCPCGSGKKYKKCCGAA
ncbi:MAG: preprotein translocase subunit SecA [Candidatus Marinimicrobia bacterium]|nr:preprotein translocase subunit SecA [Candidatus Neomarinimicrobiota bacterium]